MALRLRCASKSSSTSNPSRLRIARLPICSRQDQAGEDKLTSEQMTEGCWVKPVLVGRFAFVEWTPDNHLRHSRSVGLRHGKDAPRVVRKKSRRLLLLCGGRFILRTVASGGVLLELGLALGTHATLDKALVPGLLLTAVCELLEQND